MNAEVFLDTNVLLYSISKLPEEAGKQRIVDTLATTLSFGTSAQVCQEFYVVATGKMKHSVTPVAAAEFLSKLMAVCCERLTSQFDTAPSPSARRAPCRPR